MKEHAPLVAINEFADSSINIAVKPWVKVNDYVAAKGEIYQAILDKFTERRIQVPFPQQEIRILNDFAKLIPSSVQSRGI
jgi:small conductance mechanosensitive channel